MLFFIGSVKGSRRVVLEREAINKDLIVSITSKGSGSAIISFIKADVNGRCWTPVIFDSVPDREELGEGNSNKTDFLLSVGKGVEPGTMNVSCSSARFVDDGKGAMLQVSESGQSDVVVGTIDYLTGAIDIRVKRGLLRKSDRLIAEFYTGNNWTTVGNGSHSLLLVRHFTGQVIKIEVRKEGDIEVETHLYSNTGITMFGQ